MTHSVFENFPFETNSDSSVSSDCSILNLGSAGKQLGPLTCLGGPTGQGSSPPDGKITKIISQPSQPIIIFNYFYLRACTVELSVSVVSIDTNWLATSWECVVREAKPNRRGV